MTPEGQTPQAPMLLDAFGRALQRSVDPTTEQITLQDYFRAWAAYGETGDGWTESGPQSGKASGWYYSALHQTCQAFAQVRFKLSTEVMRRGRPDHGEVKWGPLADFWRQPYPGMTAFQWKERWMGLLLHYGNVFGVWTHVDLDGIPNELMLVERRYVEPLWEGGITDSRLWGIRVMLPGGAPPMEIRQGNYIHWKIDDPQDRFWGIPPRYSISLDLRADWHRQKYDVSFYSRAARPSAVLIDENHYLSPEQREAVSKAYEQSIGGAANAGGLAVIPGRFKFQPWNIEQANAQYIDSRKFSREQVAAVMFNFPVQLLASEESGGLSKAELEAARHMLYDNCVIPHCPRLCEPLNLWVLSRWNERHRKTRATIHLAIDEVPVIMESTLTTKTNVAKEWMDRGAPPNLMIEALKMPFDPYEGGDVGYIRGTVNPVSGINGAEAGMPDPFEVAEEVEAEEVEAESVDDDGEDDEMSEVASRALPAPTPRAKADPGDPRLEVASAILSRCEQKVRASLWGLRCQVKKDPEGLMSDGGLPSRIRSDIGRFMPPVVFAAIQVGREQARGEDPWVLGLTESEASEELLALQSDCLKRSFIETIPTELRTGCEGLVGKAIEAFEFLGMLGCEYRMAGRDADDLPGALRNLDRLKRFLAAAMVRWGINAGRHYEMTRLDKTPSRWNSATCPVDHSRDRYPGDPLTEGGVWEKILDCRCWVVEEGLR